MENNFDVIVICGGPSGYVCAIRAAHLGLKTSISTMPWLGHFSKVELSF